MGSLRFTSAKKVLREPQPLIQLLEIFTMQIAAHTHEGADTEDLFASLVQLPR